MSRNDGLEGWNWFDPADDLTSQPMDQELIAAFARCFADADGAMVRAHLQRCFLQRRVPPSSSDAELRHVEGQRTVVAHILSLYERGRG